MKRFFFLLVLMVVAVGSLGFYRGWWSVQTSSDNGKPGLNLTVDKDKIHDDRAKAVDKAQEVGRKVEEKVR